jgi:hypothetical protein
MGVGKDTRSLEIGGVAIRRRFGGKADLDLFETCDMYVEITGLW